MDISVLLEQFCSEALAFRGYAPTTLTRIRIALHLLQRTMQLQQLQDCTEAALRGFFYRGRAERNWSPQTYRTYHKSVLVFFRWCVERGLLPSNPAANIELPKVRRTLPERLTAERAERLLELIANNPRATRFERCRDLALVATMLYAGLRRMELLRLQFSDVDLINRSIFVRYGKGGKDRIVPVALPLVRILERYLEARRSAGKTCPEVFVSVRHDCGLSTNALRKVILKLRRITATPFRPHMLRHTFATLMLEGDCDLFALSQMMGHSDIKTTTLYLAASPEHLRAQIAKHPMAPPSLFPGHNRRRWDAAGLITRGAGTQGSHSGQHPSTFSRFIGM